MKNIRKLLREQSKNVLPDESVQENIRRELGLENAERSAAYAHGGTAAHGGRQKTIIALAAVLLAAALFLSVFLPIFLNRSSFHLPAPVIGLMQKFRIKPKTFIAT